MLDPDAIRDRIKVARTMRGMSQTALAALLHEEDGWGLHDLGKLERGDNAFPPTSGRRRAIAYHLQIPESFLTEESPFADDGRQLDRLEQRLEAVAEEARVDRQDLREQVEAQNENLAAQTAILKELRKMGDEIKSLVAILQDAEVIERSAVAAVRSLPEWPRPEADTPPAQAAEQATGTSDRADRRARDRRRAAS